MRKDQVCVTCKFIHLGEEGEGEEDEGECRCKSPVPIMNNAGLMFARWPTVKVDDWCGEWEQDE